MVSLNFQTRDESTTLNDGLFEDNGRCGYVLKPEFMRSGHVKFGQHSPQPADWTRILTVRVISGHTLPKHSGDSSTESIDPYVQVFTHVCFCLDQRRYSTPGPVSAWMGDRTVL